MDIENVSDITQLILNFYNTNFNINEEKLLSTTIEQKDINDLFFKKEAPLEEKKEIIKTTRQKSTRQNIYEMSFIENKLLFDKIMKYKLLEIKKKIVILRLIYVTYKYNLITGLHKSRDLEKDYKQICDENLVDLVKYIKEYIITNKGDSQLNLLLEDYTKMYNFLNTKLK